MQNPRLAERYAKSLMDIAMEQGKLDAIYADMQQVNAVCQGSREFLNLMKSPVVKGEDKNKVLEAVLSKQTDPVTLAFTRLIVHKGREFYLPEIAHAFINQYKAHNNITDVLLTTAEPLADEILATLKERIQQQLPGKTIELTSKIDNSLIGGFLLEANNNLFDASILRDLKDIKKQFLKNEYVPNIR